MGLSPANEPEHRALWRWRFHLNLLLRCALHPSPHSRRDSDVVWWSREAAAMVLTDKTILITGGTGSLGKTLVRRLLTNEIGRPRKIIVFSRDEAKQHHMRLAYQNRTVATDEVIYHNFEELVEFRIGDVRDVREHRLPVETVVGVSTDKACKPVNVMGMTKALQERVFLSANLSCPDTRFICVRYGNVLASRGSVIPLFHEQIRAGRPITITTQEMTRFLLSLNDAVNVIFGAVRGARRGETYIPRVPSAKVTDIAAVLIGDRKLSIKVTGIRPGEKVHEILVSEEEAYRTVSRDPYYCIRSILPEVAGKSTEPLALTGEYSSAGNVMPAERLGAFLESHGLLVPEPSEADELLR